MKSRPRFNRYLWEGITESGQYTHGMMAAKDVEKVKAQLMSRGIVAIRIKRKWIYYGIRLSRAHILDFMYQLCFLIQAEFSLLQALSLLSDFQLYKERKGSLFERQSLILDLKNKIEGGCSFSKALENHSTYFDRLCCGLVDIGEKTGTLEKTLNQWVIYQKDAVAFKSKILKIMGYPITVLFLSLVLAIGLLWFLIPELQHVFLVLNAPLPKGTRAILAFSNFIHRRGLSLTLILLLHGALFFCIHQRSAAVATICDKILLKVPLIGRIIQARALMQWLQAMAMAEQQGLPLVEALVLAYPLLKNRCLKLHFHSLPYQLVAGCSLSGRLEETHLFTIPVIQLIRIGEHTATLGKMLCRASEIYAMDLEKHCSYFSVCLERGIMLLLALVIGSLIMAIYLPILHMGAFI